MNGRSTSLVVAVVLTSACHAFGGEGEPASSTRSMSRLGTRLLVAQGAALPAAGDMRPPGERQRVRFRLRPGEPWLIAGGVSFLVGYVATVAWGITVIYQSSTGQQTFPPNRGLMSSLAAYGAALPLVAPFVIGIRTAEEGERGWTVFHFASGTLQVVGAIVAIFGLLMPDRWVKLPAGTVPVSSGVRWRLSPGASGTPLGATVSLDWPD